MSPPDLLAFLISGSIACLVFLIPFAYLGRVAWRVMKAAQAGNPNDIRNSLKSTLFYSKASDEFWDAYIGQVLQDLGTYNYVPYLWADSGWVRYTIYLTQTTTGRQLLLARRSGMGDLNHLPLSGHACQKLAEILKADELAFISGTALYDWPDEPTTQGLLAHLKNGFTRQFHFHALTEYGLIDERRINYPNSLKRTVAWEQAIHAFLGKKRGKFLLILKEKTVSTGQEYRWYVFDASGREILRKVLREV